jgi:predicted phage tail component-like protein
MKNFSFNGITKPYLTALRGSNRQPWAPVEWVYQDIPNREGETPIKKKVKNKQFPIPVLIQAESIPDLQKVKEDFADWLIQDDPCPLIPDDEPDRTYYAWVDGSFDPDEIVTWGQGVIPFIVKPYKFGPEKTVPFTTSVTNEGTAPANPVFTVTFTGPASEFKITHDESGKFVQVFWNFVAGSVLKIDLATRKVTIDDNLQMGAYYVKSQPFDLEKGLNHFTVTPVGVAATKITYRPRWK